MNVAVIDVGSHTVRLLVASREEGGLHALREQKAALGLGVEIEQHGRISDMKLHETVAQVRAFARAAREAGAVRIETIVTAPGRQSENGPALAELLAEAAGTPVRILTPDEEGRLAFDGAVQGTELVAETIAVIDIGGGSTEVVVGTPAGGPVWVRSVDIGALRLTGRSLAMDPPSARCLERAMREVEQELAPFTPPLPQAALAAGGTARAFGSWWARPWAREKLDAALELLSKQKSGRIAKAFGIERNRARTLPAGAVILQALQHRLGVPLEVSRTGLREGAVLAMLDELAAAA